MTLPVPLPECVRVLSLGEEDGVPVHIALVRCCVWASYVDGATPPAGAMLRWTDDRDTAYVAMPLGADQLDKHDEWFDAEPDMGACWHDIVWSTGERSSSATVSDLYLDDESVLLTVITPAAQQEQNMSEFDRPAAGVTVEGDQPNDRYVEQVRATLARLHGFLASSGQDKVTLTHLQDARSLINSGARAHDDLAEIRVFAESWNGRESSEVSTVNVVKGLAPSLDRTCGVGRFLPAGRAGRGPRHRHPPGSPLVIGALLLAMLALVMPSAAAALLTAYGAPWYFAAMVGMFLFMCVAVGLRGTAGSGDNTP